MRLAYDESPEVTRKRIYLETMSEVYPKAKQKFLMSEGGVQVLPLLELSGGL